MSWSDYVRPGSGKSMARALMAVLVAAVAWAIVDRQREWTVPMATAIGTVATTLAGVWGFSKSKWRAHAPAASEGEGTPDKEVPK